MRLPSTTDVLAAAARLRGVVVRTPLVRNHALDAVAGAPVLLKLETMQRTGSFKFRGASNFIALLPDDVRPRGVVAFSSGNHAQGVAAAAADAGIPATIVMPADAPAVKRRRTEAHGAKVVPYDRSSDDREAIAREIAEEAGVALLPPYDHPDTIAGQGTVGIEICEQVASLGIAPTSVLVPAGGGGLLAGVALALEQCLPGATAHPVEPAGYDDHARSLAVGERVAITPGDTTSICDALLAPIPGEITFEVNRRLAGPGVAVTDDEVLAAIRFAIEELRLVVEPGGAVALAAVLAGKAPGDGPWCLVLSGANLDPQLLLRALA
jgi:threonine dehydratase